MEEELFVSDLGGQAGAALEGVALLHAPDADIGERQRASEALQKANEELRLADQVKSDFVSMASHELRTPLTSILGFSSTLIEYWDSTPAADKLESLSFIDRQARRLSRLVNDLLAMSRIESGKLNVRHAIVDVVEVAQATVAGIA